MSTNNDCQNSGFLIFCQTNAVVVGMVAMSSVWQKNQESLTQGASLIIKHFTVMGHQSTPGLTTNIVNMYILGEAPAV